MANLLALLSQQASASSLQPRKALIVLGLQNDFLSSNGKLPIPDTAFVDRLVDFVPRFREFGDVVWIRSLSELSTPAENAMSEGETIVATDEHVRFSLPTKRSKNYSPTSTGDLDKELFLDSTSAERRCCIRATTGAQWDDRLLPLQQANDLQLDSSHYSAFAKTSLLFTLRTRLITELYICGCLTNISVYATAMDAARHGLQTTLIEDCLGYRQHDRHELALNQLHSIMRARALPASQIVEILRKPSAADDTWSDEDDEDEGEDEGYEDGEGSYEEDSDDDSDERHTPTTTKSELKLGHMTAAEIEVDSEDSDEEECMPALNMEMLMSRSRLVLQTSQLKISSPKMRKRQLELHEQSGKSSKYR